MPFNILCHMFNFFQKKVFMVKQFCGHHPDYNENKVNVVELNRQPHILWLAGLDLSWSVELTLDPQPNEVLA